MLFVTSSGRRYCIRARKCLSWGWVIWNSHRRTDSLEEEEEEEDYKECEEAYFPTSSAEAVASKIFRVSADLTGDFATVRLDSLDEATLSRSRSGLPSGGIIGD